MAKKKSNGGGRGKTIKIAAALWLGVAAVEGVLATWGNYSANPKDPINAATQGIKRFVISATGLNPMPTGGETIFSLTNAHGAIAGIGYAGATKVSRWLGAGLPTRMKSPMGG